MMVPALALVRMRLLAVAAACLWAVACGDGGDGGDGGGGEGSSPEACEAYCERKGGLCDMGRVWRDSCAENCVMHDLIWCGGRVACVEGAAACDEALGCGC